MGDPKHGSRKKKKSEDSALHYEGAVKKFKPNACKSAGVSLEVKKHSGNNVPSEDEVHRLHEVLKLIKDPQKKISGLKKFCQLGRQEKYQSLVLNYLKTSPDCQEFFGLLEVDERPGAEEMTLIWNAFEVILLSATGDKSLEGIRLLIVNKILTKHVRLLYSAMNPTGSSELTIAVLKLLTSFLAQGKEGVRDVLQNFDFSVKGIEVAIKKRDKRKEDDIRSCFIKLFVGFFIFGDLSAVKEALELQVLINGIIGGLCKDKLDMIHLVVKALTDKVVNRMGLTRQSKLALFTRDNLVKLATLYGTLYKRENERQSKSSREVAKDILQLLHILCTDRVHSIVFPNALGYFSVRSNNPVLLGFLIGIQKQAVTEPGLTDLISRTLASAPDLVIPFVSRLELNLERRESQQWGDNITFITEIWNKLPPINDAAEGSSGVDFEMLGCTIVPKICNRNFFTNSIKHESYIVKQKSLHLVLACLERATLVCRYVEKMKNNVDNKIEDERFESFVDGILRGLPIPRVFITLKKECSESNMNVKHTESSNDGKGNKDSAAVDAKLERSILKVMDHLQQLRPGIFTATDYDPCRLFHDHYNSMSTDAGLATHILSIALHEPRGSLKWLAKKSQIHADAMKNLLIVYVASTSTEIRDKCEQLIKKVILECRIATENQKEIGVWLEVISHCYRLNGDKSVIEFLQETLLLCIHDFFSIMSEFLEVYFKDTEGNSSDIEMTLMPNERFEFTPLVAAALRLFAMDKLKNDDKYDFGSISQAICSVLVDILMSQLNPNVLSKVILKYIKLIKEKYSKIQCKWIVCWEDLERFTVYWCYDSAKSVDDDVNDCSSFPMYGSMEGDDTGDKPLLMSVASLLRYELFSGLEKGHLSKSFKDDESFWKAVDKRINWNSADSVGWTAKIILSSLGKSLNQKFANAIQLLTLCMKELVVKCEQIVGKEDPCYSTILGLILESSAMKELYLSTYQPRASETVTQILQFALMHRTDSTADIMVYYLEKLSSEALNLLVESTSHNPFCFLNTMNTLKTFTPYLSLEERSILFTNVLGEIVTFCLNFTDRLSKAKLSDAITQIANFISDVYDKHLICLNFYSSRSFGQNAENDRKFILGNSNSATTDKISSFFELYESSTNSVVEDILVLMLNTDRSLAVLAPPNIVTVCLRMPSHKSLQILRILTQNSPRHTLVLLREFKEIPKSFPKSFLIQIAHMLLSACFSESRMKIEYAIGQKLCKDLLSILACTEDFTELSDLDLQMTFDILRAINRDEGKFLSLLIKSVEVVSSVSGIRVQSRYLLKLFEECILGRFSEQDPAKLMSSLVSLMRIWEKSVSSKDLRDETKLVETVEECIRTLCLKFIEMNCKRLKATISEKLIMVWESLLPSCLKNCIKNAHSLTTLEYLLTFLYGIKRFRTQSTLTLENVYERIFNHSQFFPILFDHKLDAAVKESLLSLLLSIAKFNPCVFEKSHLKTLMAAYGTSLSIFDQKLVILLQMYESHGISALSMRPLMWGKRLFSSTPDTKDMNLSLYDHASVNEILESLDRSIMLKSAFNFPLTLDVTKFDKEDIQLLKSRTEIYDPRFLFPVFSYILSSRFTSDCRRFIEHGCLAFTVSALSSQISSTRRAACHILVRFMNHLESAQFREKNQVVVLLNALKNSIKEEGMMIPFVVCCFTICCLQVIFKPGQVQYGIVNNLLLKKPFLDFRDGSLLMELLNNSSLQSSNEKSWVIKLIANGLRTTLDYYIYKRSHVFEHLMFLYDSPFCSYSIKEKIDDVIIAATEIHPAAFDLVKCHGLISWLSGRQSPTLDKHHRIVTEILRKVLDTFETGCKIKDDSGMEVVKKPVPKNFAEEAALLCFSIVPDYKEYMDLSFFEIVHKTLQIISESKQSLIPFSLLIQHTRILFEKVKYGISAERDDMPKITNKLVHIAAQIMLTLLKSNLWREDHSGIETLEEIAWLIEVVLNMVSECDILAETVNALSDSMNAAILIFKDLSFSDKEPSRIANLVGECVIALVSLNTTEGDKLSRKTTNLRSGLRSLLSVLMKHISSEGNITVDILKPMSSKMTHTFQTKRESFCISNWKIYLENMVNEEQTCSEGNS